MTPTPPDQTSRAASWRARASQCACCAAHGTVTHTVRRGVWISAYGHVSPESVPVCSSCLEAGCPSGPGYREVWA